MYTVRYEEIRHQESKNVKCTGCGKRLRRSRTFTNTVSPFNKNEDGTVRTIPEIRKHLRELAAGWRETPVICDPCADECLEKVQQVFTDLGIAGRVRPRSVSETAEGRQVPLSLASSQALSANDIADLTAAVDARLGLEPGTARVVQARFGTDLMLSRREKAAATAGEESGQ